MNYLKTVILLTVLTFILVWAGSLVGGPQGALIAFVIALLINGVSYWYSDKIILKIYRAYEIPRNQYHHLYILVSELAANAGIPMPRVYMIENHAPNAFATGRDPNHACVCVTKGLLALLEEDELKGVLAHEIAHIKSRDTLIMTLAATLAGAVMMLAGLARWTAIFAGGSRSRRGADNIIGLVAVAIVAPIAAVIIQLAISRSREYRADAQGAGIAGGGIALASALGKLRSVSRQRTLHVAPQTAHLFIVSPFRGNFIANLFSTHPPVDDRIEKLKKLKVL